MSFRAGEEGLHVREAELSSTQFEWYGQQYSHQDLTRALAVVAGPQDCYDQLLDQDAFFFRADACDPNPMWQQVFNSSAVFLLNTLVACPQVRANVNSHAVHHNRLP